MTIFAVEGFDSVAKMTQGKDVTPYYNAKGQIHSYSSGVPSSHLPAYFGGGYVVCSSSGDGNGWIKIASNSGDGTIVAGFRVKKTNDGSTDDAEYEGIWDIGGNYLIDYIYTSPSLKFRRKSGASSYSDIVTTSAGNNIAVLIDEKWHYFEVRIVPHNTNGNIYCKIDGQIVYSGGGLNTRPFGTAPNRYLTLKSCATEGVNWAYDDVYLAKDFIPNAHGCTVKTFSPTNSGYWNDFVTYSGGIVSKPIYTMIGQLLPTTSFSYIYPDSSGDKYTVLCTNTRSNERYIGHGDTNFIGTIHCIQPEIWFGNRVVWSGCHLVRLDNVDHSGTIPMPVNSGRFVWQNHPDGNPWNKSTFESGVEVGLVVTSYY